MPVVCCVKNSNFYSPIANTSLKTNKIMVVKKVLESDRLSKFVYMVVQESLVHRELFHRLFFLSCAVCFLYNFLCILITTYALITQIVGDLNRATALSFILHCLQSFSAALLPWIRHIWQQHPTKNSMYILRSFSSGIFTFCKY